MSPVSGSNKTLTSSVSLENVADYQPPLAPLPALRKASVMEKCPIKESVVVQNSQNQQRPVSYRMDFLYPIKYASLGPLRRAGERLIIRLKLAKFRELIFSPCKVRPSGSTEPVHVEHQSRRQGEPAQQQMRHQGDPEVIQLLQERRRKTR